MTAPDDAVAAIDAALEAWESGPDAYQWEPDAEPGLAETKPADPSVFARIAEELSQGLGVPVHVMPDGMRSLRFEIDWSRRRPVDRFTIRRREDA